MFASMSEDYAEIRASLRIGEADSVSLPEVPGSEPLSSLAEEIKQINANYNNGVETPNDENETNEFIAPSVFVAPAVFLGGSCDVTTWRKNIAIPKLTNGGVTYFNPQTPDWTPAFMELENRAKEEARLLLFVIDGQTRAIASMLEATELIIRKRTVVLYVEDLQSGIVIDNEPITGRQLKDLNRARTFLRDLAKRNPDNCVLAPTMDEAVNVVIKLASLATDDESFVTSQSLRYSHVNNNSNDGTTTTTTTTSSNAEAKRGGNGGDTDPNQLNSNDINGGKQRPIRTSISITPVSPIRSSDPSMTKPISSSAFISNTTPVSSSASSSSSSSSLSSSSNAPHIASLLLNTSTPSPSVSNNKTILTNTSSHSTPSPPPLQPHMDNDANASSTSSSNQLPALGLAPLSTNTPHHTMTDPPSSSNTNSNNNIYNNNNYTPGGSADVSTPSSARASMRNKPGLTLSGSSRPRESGPSYNVNDRVQLMKRSTQTNIYPTQATPSPTSDINNSNNNNNNNSNNYNSSSGLSSPGPSPTADSALTPRGRKMSTPSLSPNSTMLRRGSGTGGGLKLNK